jgi:hypothetical protein
MIKISALAVPGASELSEPARGNPFLSKHLATAVIGGRARCHDMTSGQSQLPSGFQWRRPFLANIRTRASVPGHLVNDEKGLRQPLPQTMDSPSCPVADARIGSGDAVRFPSRASREAFAPGRRRSDPGTARQCAGQLTSPARAACPWGSRATEAA